MSGMRRPLADDFVKCKRRIRVGKRRRISFAWPLCSGSRARQCPQNLPRTGIAPTGDLWVFGYGSLMWRPGFEFIEQVPARLIGEHRALCVYSFVHRGTPEKPGLVLGLDRGGACRGVAFRVAERTAPPPSPICASASRPPSVYREVMRSVWLENEARQRVSALVYVVDRGHVQYAGRLSLAEQLRHVLQGHGQLRRQPRLRAGDREGDRGGGLSRCAIASAGDDAARSPHPASHRPR